MKAQINRKVFLQASLATAAAGLVGCTSELGDEGDGDMGDGDGDLGSGGTGPGSGGAGSGGADTSSGGADTSSGGADTSSGGSGSGGDGGLTCSADIVAVGSGSHSHTATVTAAMLTAGAEVQITTTMGPGHEHSFTLSAVDIMTLKNGGTVTVYTCNFSDHEFVLSCDPAAPDPATPDMSDGGNGLATSDPSCWDDL